MDRNMRRLAWALAHPGNLNNPYACSQPGCPEVGHGSPLLCFYHSYKRLDSDLRKQSKEFRKNKAKQSLKYMPAVEGRSRSWQNLERPKHKRRPGRPPALTAENIAEARALEAQRDKNGSPVWTQRNIARKFGVSAATVCRALQRAA